MPQRRTHFVSMLFFTLLYAMLLASSYIVAMQRPVKTVLPGAMPDGRTRLHNGWIISPVSSHDEVLGDMILSEVISPEGRWLAAVNGGASNHRLSILDTTNGKLVSSIAVPRAQSTNGLVFSPDGKTIYVSGANAGRIYRFLLSLDGKLTSEQAFQIPRLRSVFGATTDPAKDPGRDPAGQDETEQAAYLGGLALSPDGLTIYITNLAADDLYSINVSTGKVIAERRFELSSRPSSVTVSHDGKSLYVALLGAASVLNIDPATLKVRANYRTGAHPNAMALNRSDKRLFVSCGNDDSVYVIDTLTGAVRDRISMHLGPLQPPGTTPSALVLSPDDTTLFVANSDNNDAAVVDVTSSGAANVRGFIPTTWYPTTLAVSPDGKRLFVGSGKGYGVGKNDKDRPIDPIKPGGYPYIVNLMKGVVSCVNVPDQAELTRLSSLVKQNSQLSFSANESLARQADHSGLPTCIKHVLYIIKENRTYDQVFGDLKDASGKKHGNGDPDLCIFGENVTPNQHALARVYVTLDNLYADGEVSVDGHHWSNGAYVPDAMQRTWPSEYGGKGGTPIRYGDFGDPLAETPSGRIWDQCEKAGVSYRTYYYHVDKHCSDKWNQARAAHERDYKAVDIYLRDLQRWTATGSMPGFVVMALSEDHTSGTRPGTFTPQASVASNDLAIGKLIDALSHSQFWKGTAVFIIEDDAQNGADHVDAHRTVGLVVSPYTRRGIVDSTMYSTCSMLHTMESILGVPCMSQYDASAQVMSHSFSRQANLTPFNCLPPKIDLNAKNGATAYGARESMKLDLSDVDRLTAKDEVTLNKVIWHSIKGSKVPYRGPTSPARDDD